MELSFANIEKAISFIDKKYIVFASSSAYFGIGALFGVAAKNFLKFFIVSVIICIFLIKGLEYSQILTINWAILNKLLGLDPSSGLIDFLQLMATWAQKNIFQALSATIGFVIGFKFG